MKKLHWVKEKNIQTGQRVSDIWNYSKDDQIWGCKMLYLLQSGTANAKC